MKFDNTKVVDYVFSHWDLILLIIILFLISFIRLQLIHVPLERDEGEYAYAAQLILQGVPPYSEVYSMKMPGMYAIYALILALLGQTHSAIHLGLLLVNGATVLLVFFLARRVFDPLSAVVASASFALLSVSQPVEGIFANAEHFVILPTVGGALLLFHATESDRPKLLFWSGLLFGTAFMIKQHGGAFAAFAGFYLVSQELRRQPVRWLQFLVKGLLLVAGAILPFILACLLFAGLGVFERFWFWTFVYAREYVSLVPLSMGWELLKLNLPILASAMLLWILAGVGFTALLWDNSARHRCVFTLSFLIFSICSVCPGLYFRRHYFVLILPSIALLVGISVSSLVRLLGKRSVIRALPILCAMIALIYSIYYQRYYLFEASPTMLARSTYGANPFPESLKIARYIEHHTTNNDHVAVLGSEPQIYFYANRRAATRYIYAYPLMEPHKFAKKMQEEMIADIETSRPRFLVFVNVYMSWLVRPTSEHLVFTWFRQFQQDYYQLVGIVDIISSDETVWRWGDAAAGYVPRSQFWLAIFRERSGAPYLENSGSTDGR
jgi:hypothetical protein